MNNRNTKKKVRGQSTEEKDFLIEKGDGRRRRMEWMVEDSEQNGDVLEKRWREGVVCWREVGGMWWREDGGRKREDGSCMYKMPYFSQQLYVR